MIRDGGQAFPSWMMGSVTHDGITHPCGPNIPTSGMTMRKFYKGKALQGELAAQSTDIGEWGDSMLDTLARRCGRLADAMLAEDEEHEKEKV